MPENTASDPLRYEAIRLARDGAVATITLHRPQALNAITVTMLQELSDALRRIAADEQVAVVILTGEGRAFSAGVDLKELGKSRPEEGTVGGGLNGAAREVIRRIGDLPAVVMAKINGHCFTGALELALACDIIVTADEASFGDTHAKWGLRPTWGMSQRLPAIVGIARARELSYSARVFKGTDAAAWGLASVSCPLAELDATVAALAEAVAANSRGSLLAYKDLYRAAERMALPEGLAYEAATEYPITDTGARVRGFK